MRRPEVAVLGAGSHVAKGLVCGLLDAGEYRLRLHARAPDAVRDFLGLIGRAEGPDCTVHGDFDLAAGSADVVVNCVGVGTARKLQGDYSRYFTVTEEFDNLALDYLRRRRPDALYVSFSSGAVYGRGHAGPVGEHAENCIPVNHVPRTDSYAIARLYAEAKHRSLPRLRIVDLRLFSYFSRFIDLAEGYFITEVLDCVASGKVLRTGPANIVRDYVHPDDLCALVRRCIAAGAVNGAYDVRSTRPAEKREILEHFAAAHGLRYEVDEAPGPEGPTGSKDVYCSAYENALDLGHRPRFSSMDAIRQESARLLAGLGRGGRGGAGDRPTEER